MTWWEEKRAHFTIATRALDKKLNEFGHCCSFVIIVTFNPIVDNTLKKKQIFSSVPKRRFYYMLNLGLCGIYIFLQKWNEIITSWKLHWPFEIQYLNSTSSVTDNVEQRFIICQWWTWWWQWLLRTCDFPFFLIFGKKCDQKHLFPQVLCAKSNIPKNSLSHRHT